MFLSYWHIFLYNTEEKMETKDISPSILWFHVTLFLCEFSTEKRNHWSEGTSVLLLFSRWSLLNSGHKTSKSILSLLTFFQHKNSFGIKRRKGLRKRTNSPVWRRPQVHSPPSDPHCFARLPRLFWWSLLLKTLLKSHRLLSSLWGPRESPTSGFQCRMMSRLALTQSPSHREFFREVAVFFLCLPDIFLPWGACGSHLTRPWAPEHRGLTTGRSN